MALPNLRTGHSPNYTEPSLPALPPHLQSDTHLTAHLASRLSSQALICLNNYSSSAQGPDGGKEGSAMGEAEDLAQRAWTRLGARGENQAVVFLGESGAGKTTVRAHLLSSFLAFSSTPLSTKISLAAFVFDTLTTTKSVTTPTASKAGLFLELQYDATAPSPTLIGGKLLDHRLERSRIAAVPTGERSFHVLYYLLAGTSASEKAHLGLNDPGVVADGGVSKRSSGTVGHKRWRYLGHPTQLKVGINDAEGFQHFKVALRKLEFPRGEVAEICQILACILHIGQLEFTTGHYTTPTGEESGGYSHDGGEEVTVVKNKEVLANVAAFLGLGASELEASLGYKTKTIHQERVTVMLDPNGARANADELAKTLYSLLVAYILEQINQRTCAAEEAIARTISIVDFPGFAQTPSTGSTLDQLLTNAATEMLYNQCLFNFFERRAHFLESEDVHVPATSYFDNADALKTLLKPSNGLLSILDDQSKRGKTDAEFLEAIRKRFQHKSNAIAVGSATKVVPGSNFASRNLNAAFTVKHYAGEVDYHVSGLLEENGAVISGDMMNLINSTRSDFVRELFGQDALQSVMHPREKTAVMQAQVSSKPSRMPSMARRKADQPARAASTARSDPLDPRSTEKRDRDAMARRSRVGEGKSGTSRLGHPDQGAAGQFQASLDNIKRVISSAETNAYYVFCLKPNDRRIANQFDSKCVRSQLQIFGIVEISQRLRNADISLFMPFGQFLSLTQHESMLVGNDGDRVEAVIHEKQWPAHEALVGATGVFLSERCWASVASVPPGNYGDDRRPRHDDDDDGMLPPAGMYGKFADSETRLITSRETSLSQRRGAKHADPFDTRSEAGASAFHSGDMFRNLQTREQMAEKGNAKDMIEVENVVVTGSRKRWLAMVYLLTFYIPDFMIKWLGRMPRKDIRTAWREKLAINLLIWLSCGTVIFFIVVFPQLICPKQYVYSPAELATYNGKGGAGAYVAVDGVVIDLGKFMPNHFPHIIPQSALKKYAGLDATGLFPIQVSAMCQGKNLGQNLDDSIAFDYTPVNVTGAVNVISAADANAQYHDFRSFTKDPRPDWFKEQMLMLRATYKVGYVGYSPQYVSQLGSQQKSIAILNGRIYDFTAYVKGGRRANAGVDTYFMDSTVVDLFQNGAGTDVTRDWHGLPISTELRNRMQLCLDNLFFVGALDTRNSVQCQFANYLLLAISILLCSVIGFKFFAALQFGRKSVPENLDKFVICQVPAYTEDEESLRRAIDSAARMKYDDKRKLLLVICDGMIIGQGNDRPTPRIVLDILGVAETVDPEPLSFESLGEGMKQHNMGKVYSGLYEAHGHIVPFLVVVKVGKPSEASRPGNRGKRDSQMVVMRFLNRVHYNLPMNPLELEMHHQIRNIIGVNPTFYEFLFQIDADTMVAPDSATRMVAAFLHDSRLIGICGETALSNAKSSYITMIQVYEYYISHNLTKAFESLFGSVTCLPGCFSMYRIRAAETGKPLFVSTDVVDAYANIRVDTLHMKNLLHLGEDRYLTTLLMKHHSKYKTKYTFHAHAWTVAPDSWTIFMSQRRRWINSTVHNLMELIPLQQLCGFCCFSMRFVVFVDLLSTIVQPVTVFYVAYLIVLVAMNSSVIPLTAFILLGAIYGLQAIIFILRRKWEMIGWMLLYVLAMPVFSLGLPLYAFWHMDDFTWGNTRVVTGEKGRQVVITDEGRFDPASIPRTKWEDYQAELWEAQSQGEDNRSEASGISYGTKSFLPTPSEPGYAASRHSHLEVHPPPLPPMASRLSLAPSEFLGTTPGAAMELEDLPGLPDDAAILAEIRDVLKTADLMTVTKKNIKAELEARFGMSLEWKKAYIGSATEAVLSGQL